ncbi:E3 SUMO-protein ligase PIAS2 isoform X4 [Pteropus medius]|uniref:E3 SUMO-protein ligase PIAS2 isoform X3 n=2 Tax=Pteropus vampyrus TaxID=132908 RepID=A0A6P6CHX3_PTEVA|nr:E3 SUMO-protein ligase PIAS2 isoform X3 [Pteropus vampyrus]XP_023387076.1 E3 SUMO-protein ligase PIAS2 isoform X3 [Pteropus vampyrus]XP_023387085.1 E3 SUMO-protein ligase PIAS2 isoform X3 [Pteropus vampyrus]XP_039698313.1 E3 SUMO-protein ligase PIAS2 isoform X4 [Pteropus giganteus]XP_039698323.1 E3 SUMO-protein ligase PIAS2 isoform X4 [Pteropus giganteus]XP_039698333.1 E3 SUMO-protein ligase PIAS2 isoform X4 [Pteropus giganteus]
MVSSFRVSELQVLLGFAGRNKSGRKHDLLMRALHLLKSGCSPAVQIKIRELYRRRYPRTLEGLSDLSTIKSSVFNLDGSSSPVEPDLTVAGIHALPSTSVTPHSPSSPVGSVLLQDTKPTFEMQQPSPPIPPVHPDVQLKNLPFYDVLDVLIKPTSLVQSSIQRFQEKFFIFALTPQQVREICISRDFLPGGRRDYTVQVQLRLCLAETSCPQEDNYPNSLCIKVNGKLFPLPGYAPPPKNGIEQKRPGRPLNITSLVRLSSAVPNQISISWASEIGKNYSMSVYLVRQLTSAMLLQRLKMKGIRNPDHSRALIKEKLTADPDSEIATTSLRVSLMCPLGKMRLTIPCRAVTCTHLQCFDAALYLQMNEKKPTWICPVCDKKAAYESLILDGLFMEILNDCSDVDEIKFQEDGSWCPMRPKKEAMKVSSQPCTKIESSSVLSKPCSVTVANEASKKKVDVIDLTIESSSDEEDDPPAKRKCIFMSETQSSPTKGVLMYQPSSVRVPSVTSVDPAAIPPSLTDYSVPFHHTPISSMSSDLPGLDFLSLIPVDPQESATKMQYCPPMFLDSLTSPLTASSTSVTTTSPHESSTHVSSSSSRSETGVITSSGSNIPDIISLD